MSTVTRSMVLWVPDWPIIASLRVTPLPVSAMDAPVALIDKGIVFACSASARIEGVQRGLRVREAQARCTDLVVRPYEQQLDSRTFEIIIDEPSRSSCRECSSCDRASPPSAPVGRLATTRARNRQDSP